MAEYDDFDFEEFMVHCGHDMDCMGGVMFELGTAECDACGMKWIASEGTEIVLDEGPPKLVTTLTMVPET